MPKKSPVLWFELVREVFTIIMVKEVRQDICIFTLPGSFETPRMTATKEMEMKIKNGNIFRPGASEREPGPSEYLSLFVFNFSSFFSDTDSLSKRVPNLNADQS